MTKSRLREGLLVAFFVVLSVTMLVVGVLFEQVQETLFNATLV